MAEDSEKEKVPKSTSILKPLTWVVPSSTIIGTGVVGVWSDSGAYFWSMFGVSLAFLSYYLYEYHRLTTDYPELVSGLEAQKNKLESELAKVNAEREEFKAKVEAIMQLSTIREKGKDGPINEAIKAIGKSLIAPKNKNKLSN